MKDLTKDKRPYEAPQLTVVSFKVEQGYAFSGVSSSRNSYGNGGDDPNDQSGNNQTWF